MPGTFTHWMIAEQALDHYGRLPAKHPLFSKIQAHYHFVAQGAIGPDYPYLTEKLQQLKPPGIRRWGDRMHFENTGELVARGAQNLRALQGKEHAIGLAWLCGFATHVIADAMVHPVVNLAVSGIALFTDAEHRLCEMTQDSWIYHDITGHEIAQVNYADRLKLCSDPNDSQRVHPTIRSLWTDTLRATHPAASAAELAAIDPDEWHKNVIQRLPLATNPVPIFRHVGDALHLNLTYPRLAAIPPADLDRFVTNVKIPDGNGNGAFVRGHFRTGVFDAVVDRVVDVWHLFLVDVARQAPSSDIQKYLRNWDLDRGIDLDALTLWA